MSNRIMVSTTAGEWEGVQHRPHHFMKRAAESGRTVIFIEPPVSLIAPLKNRKLISKWKSWFKGPKHVNEKFIVLSPPPFLPFGNKYRSINNINQWLLSKSIKNIVSKLNGSLELYSFLPNSVDLLKHIKFSNVYYDCVDDHASFTGLINKEVVEQMEKELMEQSDVCFATANQLLEDRRAWSNNFHLVQNGAEFEHFAQVQTSQLLVPWDIENVKDHSIVGFIGGISDWIDLQIIEDAAKQLPNVTFVMIGPVDTNIESIKKQKNVIFLGSKPYNQLPNYIQSFDICLIPFKINKLTKSVNPIKMYEYLSAGKPIISTPLPEVVLFKDVIEIVSSKDEIVKAINDILEHGAQYNSDVAIHSRQEIGRQNSWNSRWLKVEKLIKKTKGAD